MNDILKNSYIAATVGVLIFWLSYNHLTKSLVMQEPAKEDTVAKTVIKTPRPKVEPVQPDPPPALKPVPSGVEFPKTYYTKVRIVEQNATGVHAIPQNQRVRVVATVDSMMTVTDGRATVTTSQENIRVSP